jgi:YesN/AraC family two-component response regulator
MALSEGKSVGTGTTEGQHPRSALSELRRKLAEEVATAPQALPARFERYIEAASRQCGFRLEPLAIHLEVGFERILEGLSGTEPDRKALADLRNSLERATNQARTVAELSAAYRRAVLDLSDAVQHPAQAHHDRNLRRAVKYIHEHYAETLSLPSVARVAGFAPTYFSLLFKQREHMTFADYVQRLRVERAHQLLATTDIGLQRVAQLAGFSNANYMARVFRKLIGTAPRAMRKRLR